MANKIATRTTCNDSLHTLILRLLPTRILMPHMFATTISILLHSHFYFFSVKYLNAHTGIVFLRCRKSHYRLIWSALPFITSLENRGQRVPCFLNCLHVGGKTDQLPFAWTSCSWYLGCKSDTHAYIICIYLHTKTGFQLVFILTVLSFT